MTGFDGKTFAVGAESTGEEDILEAVRYLLDEVGYGDIAGNFSTVDDGVALLKVVAHKNGYTVEVEGNMITLTPNYS